MNSSDEKLVDKKNQVSTFRKDFYPSYSIARDIITKYHLTPGDKEKINKISSEINDRKIKAALDELLGIKND